MHGKEQVIAPLLEKQLGVEIVVPQDFDTDAFGTFSGEVARYGSPLDAARNKCRAAAHKYGCSLVVASEGSFGPHPTAFFIPADDELLLLTDFDNGLEIAAREISTATNFGGVRCTSWADAEAFAVKAQFPTHRLIVKNEHDNNTHIVKGIGDWQSLQQHVLDGIASNGSVFIETDMRAMYNPMRMKVIKKAVWKLADKIACTCPICNTPGFDVVDVLTGLPCGLCGTPTQSIASVHYKCTHCSHTEQKQNPKGKKQEDPMYCDVCNP